MNPYSSKPDYCFWRRAVSRVPRNDFDPVTRVKFRISPLDRVATAGSCFAQHISRRLRATGFNYFVPENGTELSEEERKLRNFGVFSARYGNVYTARQLLQLFDEAFGFRCLTAPTWRRPDGRWVDALRPLIEPAGFESEELVAEARLEHLSHVRRVFESANVFLFTLGLTEAWTFKSDGRVLPLAPGVSAGNYEPEKYEFVNFDVGSVIADLEECFAKIKSVNQEIKILLTVSPVPMIATSDDRNVLVSNTYSKSVLRVAADHVQRNVGWVDYFPSYEIITGSYCFGQYYEEDARLVNHIGLSHTLRVFLRHYAEGNSGESASTLAAQSLELGVVEPRKSSEIVCDEEAIAAIRV